MWIVLIILLILARGHPESQAYAQPSPPLSPFPSNGFQITGSWACSGAFRAGKAHRAAFTGAVILGGTWLELAEEDVEPSTGYQARYLIGYSSEGKRLVEFDANNFGAAVYGSEQGWQDNVLTMTSPVSENAKAPYALNRFRYSVTGKDELQIDWEIEKSAASSWVTADHLACKRSAAS